MAKVRKQFVCSSCGTTHPQWMGKCPDCGKWDALEEVIAGAGATQDKQRGTAQIASQSAPRARPIQMVGTGDDESAADSQRLPCGITEFDRVLGGSGEMVAGGAAEARGLVAGSAVLVGGDPGIGKSTLMLQAAGQWSAAGTRVLYVTTEESAQQLRMRAERLGVFRGPADELFVLADTNLARVVEQCRKVQPAVMVIDSIQMMYKGDLPAAPGSVTQLRTCCMELVYMAKATGCAVLFVGHVTKEGRLAGPRLLEHMVDTVLYFEGDRYHSHRVLRGIKNRFGSTLEVGLFEMTGSGLSEVRDGSGLLAAEYRPASGSVVCPVLQGSRCLLVEIQALTATGILGAAKRKTSGLDGNRLAMLIAVLEKRGELRLADQDIFASSVGGMKIVEPAADLPIALAIAGAHYNRSLSAGKGKGVAAIGEVGLGGEVRHVQQLEQRIHEAARMGFTHVLCPRTSIKPPAGCSLMHVDTLSQALEALS